MKDVVMGMFDEKKCDQCGRKFPLTIPGTTCPDCLIRPQKGESDIIQPFINRKEAIMPNLVKEKICIDCGHSYAPTSNVQKRCRECMEKHEKEYMQNYKKPKKQKVIGGNAVKSNSEISPAKVERQLSELSSSIGEEALILRMLVAIGLVSEEKVNQARKIVNELNAGEGRLTAANTGSLKLPSLLNLESAYDQQSIKNTNHRATEDELIIVRFCYDYVERQLSES